MRRLARKPRVQMNTSAGPEPERVAITRRHFLKLGTLGAAAASMGRLNARAAAKDPPQADTAADLEYLTREEDFVNVGRGKPPPHELSDEKRRAVGLTPRDLAA